MNAQVKMVDPEVVAQIMGVPVELKFLDLPLYADEQNNLHPPQYATPGSAAFDLRAAETVLLKPGECRPIKTGIALHPLVPNVCAVVLPRSGLGGKQGLILGNSVGLIDNDYQGEIMCYMWNRNTSGDQPLVVERGARFAQLMFLPYLRAVFHPVTEFSNETQRGEGGFGSTGT